MHGVKLRLVSNIGSENARLKDSSFASPSNFLDPEFDKKR
jgi:hypothetical protein